VCHVNWEAEAGRLQLSDASSPRCLLPGGSLHPSSSPEGSGDGRREAVCSPRGWHLRPAASSVGISSPPPRAPQLLHHHARDGEAAVPQVRSDLPPVGRRQRQGRGAHHGGGLPDPGGRPAVGGRRFAEELGFSKNATFPPPGPSPPPYTHTRVASPCRQTLSVPPSLEIPPVGLRMLCALYQELS